MKVFVTGATGVLGRHAVIAMVNAGHDVAGLARCDSKAAQLRELGVTPVTAPLFDVDELAPALEGFDAVCNLVTHIPVGFAGMRPGAWRVNDRLRTQGSKSVAEAAARAGVHRLVQESVSFLYADGGDEWLTEASPLSVTRAAEPVAVAEANAAGFGSKAREAVVLRFGTLVGDDPMTQWMLERARAGRSIGMGDGQDWVHLVHPADAGAAVLAALGASSGIYNAGADPVRRIDVMRAFAEAVSRDRVASVPPLLQRLAGERLELLTRSHRVSSDLLHGATGWKPEHAVFGQSWLRQHSAA